MRSNAASLIRGHERGEKRWHTVVYFILAKDLGTTVPHSSGFHIQVNEIGLRTGRIQQEI